MSERHRERMAEFLREEISRIIISELADPRISFSTVTEVELTDDFSVATVKVSFLLPSGKRKAAMAALNSSAGFIRNRVKPLIRSKRVPSFRFVLDEGVEKSARIAELLRSDKDSSVSRSEDSVPGSPEE